MPPLVARFSSLGSGHRGILWILLAGAVFSSQDAIAKVLGQTYPTIEVLWGRFVPPVVVLAFVYRGRLREVMATRQLGLQLLRSGLTALMLGFLFAAYRFMPLADATAVMFVGPVLVVALSWPLLGERVGPRRWAAVAVGCLGALIIVRPGLGVFHPAALLALVAAALSALHQCMIRILSRTDTALSTLLYTSLVGAAVAMVAAPFFWVAPDAQGWSLMILLGVLGIASQYCIIKGFEAAPAATVAPFMYTLLIWATLYGLVLFGDFPDVWTMCGAAVIVASGIYIAHRERVRGHAPPAPRRA